ncbi:hypothetical protein LTR27_009547 [Elasticomyces elasticus]|nr:hypothetical protein LTR27_009547 [Elasticomyces elasticus]
MQYDPLDDPPEIPILLLGDSGVGKSTFLSRLSLGQNHSPTSPLPTLHALDQPYPFNISLYNRKYRLEFSDTASPTNYTLLKPAVIILCYSIADPVSLHNLKAHWRKEVDGHFSTDERIPVIVLGLQRDVRKKEDYDGLVRVERRDDLVYPQEAMRVSQEMRSDRYCECSALSGELCREVFEDIAKTAAMTTTEGGGKTRGMECAVM